MMPIAIETRGQCVACRAEFRAEVTARRACCGTWQCAGITRRVGTLQVGVSAWERVGMCTWVPIRAERADKRPNMLRRSSMC